MFNDHLRSTHHDRGARWVPVVLLFALLASAKPTSEVHAATARPPNLNEARTLWEGGGWGMVGSRGAGWLSGFKSLQDYENPDTVPPNPAPLKPEPAKVYHNIRVQLSKGRSIFNPTTECHPPGLPYMFTFTMYGGYEVVVGAHEIVMLFGGEPAYRRIYLDGRTPPPEGSIPATYYGYSVGRWEGRALVIETNNLRGENTEIEPHMPKAEGSHLTERYTPAGPGLMNVEMTMTNPDFTRPWIVKFQIRRGEPGKLIEALCSDGNRWLKIDGELKMLGPDNKPLAKAED
jgi:hypothetical protein